MLYARKPGDEEQDDPNSLGGNKISAEEASVSKTKTPDPKTPYISSLMWGGIVKGFLGAKAPLGLVHINVNVNVQIKKFEKSSISLELVRYC